MSLNKIKRISILALFLASVFSTAFAQVPRNLKREILDARIVNSAPALPAAIAAGSFTITQASHILAAETGTADSVTAFVVSTMQAGDTIKIMADTGDTITIDAAITDTGAAFDLSGDKFAFVHVQAGGAYVVSLGGGSSRATESFDTYALLKARPFASFPDGSAVVITQDSGRNGVFIRETADISACVTLDPAEAVCIADPLDTDGSSGGFERLDWDRDAVNVGWWGGVIGREISGAVATANAAALEAANLFQSTRGGGTITWAGTLEVDCSVSNQTPVAIALRNNASLVGVKPENSSALFPELGRDETGAVLRLHDGSNCSLVGLRTGNKGQGVHDLVLDVNKTGNPNPGNHAIMVYAHDSSNGHGDGLMVSGVRAENATGYSLYLFDADPAEIHNNDFRDGVFLGAQADTNFSENIVDGNSPRNVSFNASSNVSGAAVNLANHGVYNGLKVLYDKNGGTVLSGLTDLTDYYVVNATEDTFQVSATYGGSAIAIVAGSSETQLFKPYPNRPALFVDGSNHNHIVNNLMFGPQSNAQRSATFTRSTNNIVVSDYQGFLYANAPVMVENSGGALPAGLDAHNVYYARQVSGTSWALYTGPGSGATQVTMSDAGTGTHTVRFGKYSETFLFSGSLLGQQSITVDSNRIAGSWGSNATLINIGMAAKWSDTNDLYEENYGGTTYMTIEQLGDNVDEENIGFPYKRRFVFTNGIYATNDDAPLPVNQGDFCNNVRKQASGALRCNFTSGLTNFATTDDFAAQCDQRFDLNIGYGSKFTTAVDIWVKDKYADAVNTSSTPITCIVSYAGW